MLNDNLFQAQGSKEVGKTLTSSPTEKERELHLLKQCPGGIPEWELSATPCTHFGGWTWTKA